MSVHVKLADILEGMELDMFEVQSLLNKKTGEVVYLDNHYYRKAENDEPYDDLPIWEQDAMKLAHDVLEHEGCYIRLPFRFEIDEYRMMQDFCFMQSNEVQDTLLNDIQGKGSFSRFKNRIYSLGLENAWYIYRDKCYRKIAIEFCKRHNLQYE